MTISATRQEQDISSVPNTVTVHDRQELDLPRHCTVEVRGSVTATELPAPGATIALLLIVILGVVLVISNLPLWKA